MKPNSLNAASRTDRLLRSKQMLITCGTGGVGKTTLSAALALRAAIIGLRVAVITIDPAKRLATSLGIDELGDHPTDLTPRVRAALGHELTGSLHAIVPDTRRTFEQLIIDLGFDEAGATRVKNNPIFKIFAREFSGTNEYMAMQRLYSLHGDPAYDLIILDTPPSRNTLDFLDAPKLLARFYEDRIFQWLIVPANKIASGAVKKALGLLERLTGGGFVGSLLEFVGSMFEVRASFTTNLRKVTEMLEGTKTGFILVASPSPENVSEIKHFLKSIEDHHFHFEGLMLNRTVGGLEPSTDVDPDPRLDEARKVLTGIQAREAFALSQFNTLSGAGEVFRLPELARDVHSVEDLIHVAMAFD